jgi:hypothetical protein
MKTTVKSRSARPSVAVAAAAAMLAFWLTLGGPQAVRAEDTDILSAPGQDMVLVPAKTVSELEQRVIYLEETVAALTESWQHINTHRLCVSDDSGAETCISKPQLDALLIQFAEAKISEPPVAQEAAVAPPAEPVEVAAVTPAPAEPTAEEPTTVWTPDAGKEPMTEATTVVGEISPPDQDPDVTGTVKLADQDSSAGPVTGAAVLSYPKVEIYEEPIAQSDNQSDK